jgi:hypothetical protein
LTLPPMALGGAGPGRGEAWAQAGKIMVPGSWEAQGYGNETVQMKHQASQRADNSYWALGGRGFGKPSGVLRTPNLPSDPFEDPWDDPLRRH